MNENLQKDDQFSFDGKKVDLKTETADNVKLSDGEMIQAIKDMVDTSKVEELTEIHRLIEDSEGSPKIYDETKSAYRMQWISAIMCLFYPVSGFLGVSGAVMLIVSAINSSNRTKKAPHNFYKIYNNRLVETALTMLIGFALSATFHTWTFVWTAYFWTLYRQASGFMGLLTSESERLVKAKESLLSKIKNKLSWGKRKEVKTEEPKAVVTPKKTSKYDI